MRCSFERSHFQQHGGLDVAKKKKKKDLSEKLSDERSALSIDEVASDEMESELSAIKQSLLSGGNWAQLITRLIAPPPRSMAVTVSRCGEAFFEWRGNSSRRGKTMSGSERSNFLKEAASESARNHRRALTANVLTAKSVLEFPRNGAATEGSA